MPKEVITDEDIRAEYAAARASNDHSWAAWCGHALGVLKAEELVFSPGGRRYTQEDARRYVRTALLMRRWGV